MPSKALTAFESELPEVEDLLTAKHDQDRGVRAIRRASTVALSGHYERYLYALDEEAIEAVNARGIGGLSLPQPLRLYHTKPAVKLLYETNWDQQPRVVALERFVQEEMWLWSSGLAGTLVQGRLLEFMTAPTPLQVMRYFGYWGIGDIFSAITRAPHVRSRIYVKILELVDRRNGIAHGDPSVEPTYQDVVSYRKAVRTFCSRVDQRMSKRLGELIGTGPVW